MESLVTACVFMGLVVVVSLTLSPTNLSYADRGVALGVIMLSIVMLTGYGGQVSLCQLTFAGLGAFAMSKVGGTGGSLLGLLAAVGLTAGVGALVSLPALRLRGLYLALATLAFAYGMDNAFFNNIRVFGVSLSLPVARPHVPGVSLKSNSSYLVLLSLVFTALAIGLLAIRRSRFGRRLIAVNDSPSACVTLGIGMTGTKLAVFTLSAAVAGLGGALYGGAQGAVAPNDFSFIVSLTLLLLAVAWGVRTIGGMLVAGVLYALGPLLQQHLTQPRDVVLLLVGLAAIGVSQNPEGTFGGNTVLQKWRDRRADGPSVASPATTPNATADGRLSHAAG
jgi:branched-chain amino acid transport system permease protein